MKTKENSAGYFVLRHLRKWTIIAAAEIALNCQALTVVSGPSFTPATNAPLAGELALQTDAPSQVSVTVFDGIETWQRDFFDYGTNHSLSLLGFKLNRTNQITVTVRDAYRNSLTVAPPLTFVTGPLPTNMPMLTLITNDPSRMEPGYTMFRVQNSTVGGACVLIVDNFAEVVWYAYAGFVGGSAGPIPTPSDVQQLTNGNLFFVETSKTGFAEVNMLGQTVETWSTPSGYLADEHEDLLTDHGTILYVNIVAEDVTNFPSSATDSNAPTENALVEGSRVVEISATNSALLNFWTLIDMLDPVRIDYLCFQLFTVFGNDPEHANAIIDQPADDSLIVSLRNQDAVIKFTRAGQIKWILGPPENWGPEWQPFLLTPVGTPFEWNYGQHAPTITPQGTLLLYDDGNCRAEPFAPPVPDQDNYSRAAEFSIDETNMQVSQVWEFTGTNTDRLFTSAVGNATWLPQTGNVLVDFGYVSYENGLPAETLATNATIVHLKEVTHEAVPQVVFDLEMADPTNNVNTNSSGYLVYRSHHIPDLYVHPANPVANLIVQIEEGQTTVQFTADPVRNYVVQASEDLVNWNVLGVATPEDDDGDFYFIDDNGNPPAAEFYRVLTE